jgi:type I restriction enzyme S subunit
VTATLKPYPEYGDSGLAWLGDVPEHWDVGRAKWLFQKMERPVRETDEVVTCFRDGVVTLRKNRRVRGFTESLKEIGYQGIRRGDLVIHGMDAFAGAVGVSDSDGKGTPVYSVCEPASSANAHYYSYVVREMARSEWILALAKGIRERSTDFRFDGFASQPVPLPPLFEQAAIVRFLDHLDRRIRRYIAAKKKLIALLNEQKQAIIHRAVTRGLDPSVRLKPSGVGWLGDVPEHWAVVRTRYVLGEVDNRSASGEETHLSMSQKLGLVPSSILEQHALVSESYAGGKLCEKDDLVLNRLKAHLGVFALASQMGVISPDYTVLRQIQPVSMRYCELIFRSPAFRGELKVRAKGIVEGFWRLYTDDFYDIRIPIPPLAEQERIVAEVEGESRRNELVAHGAEREISLLREYRTRLIADVVTGKLDVRDAAAGLPDEAEQIEPLGDVDAPPEGEGSEDEAALDTETGEIEG